jgi:hypothetical protein
MPNYKYKCVPVPSVINTGTQGKKMHQTAVEKYEKLINTETVGGWELDKIDTITSVQNPGCLSSIFGGKGEIVTFKIMIFRMEI